jgi:hypothetical protein
LTLDSLSFKPSKHTDIPSNIELYKWINQCMCATLFCGNTSSLPG